MFSFIILVFLLLSFQHKTCNSFMALGNVEGNTNRKKFNIFITLISKTKINNISIIEYLLIEVCTFVCRI